MAAHGLNHNLSEAFARARQGETLVALGLLLILWTAAIVGITITLAGQDWGTLWRSLLLGLLIGWALAILRQPLWRTVLAVVLVGLLYVLLFPGGMIGKVLEAASAFVHMPPGTWISLKGGRVDLSPLAGSLQELSVATGIVLMRVRVWLAALVSGQPAFDPVAATLVWNALVWLGAAWAGWVVEARRNALLAALPAVLLSLETLAYGWRMSFVVYLMLGSLLLLLAVVQQGQRQQLWNATRVAFPVEKGRQIVFNALLITVALVLFSAFTSSLSFERIQNWIDRLREPSPQQDDSLANSLGITPGETVSPDAFTAVRSPGLPEDHLIGAGPELSQRVVMTVSVRNLVSLAQGGGPLPLYWRAFTYDVYTGNGWRSSSTEQSTLGSGQSLQTEHFPHQVLIQQQVRPVENLGGVVYAAGEPVTVNLQSEAAWRSSGDLFGIRVDSSVPYAVESLIPIVDEGILRAAGQQYPDWVKQRYLALPTEVPDRVRTLAIELTATEPTPYDRARAIQGYLRTFPYTLDVSQPPLNRDVVDYFLFDLKKGYCDYYASSMVVLARAAGIPARLVIGYASGTYNLNAKRFVVTEADAHSWVEVYFPDIGWVPFEPTASRPVLERTGTTNPETVPGQDLSPSVSSKPGLQPLPWTSLSLGLLLVGLLGATWMALKEFRLRRLPRPLAAAEVYRRIRWYGRRLSVTAQPGETPSEYAAALSARLRKLAERGGRWTFGEKLIQEIEAVMDGIVRTSYSPVPPGDIHLLRQWRVLRWRLRWLWVLQSLNAFLVRFRKETGYQE
jgi:transglutaminase-like putative cysteine protease